MKQFVYLVRPPRPTFNDDATEEEEQAVVRHFVYLKCMLAEGRLVLAGPCTDAAFGIVIFEAEDEEQAEKVVREDPAVAAGVFTAELHPYNVSLLRS